MGLRVVFKMTVNLKFSFGSNIMGEKTNIIYNNQMDDFASPNSECNSYSLPNYSINYIEPGKRPVSSMTPLIALTPDKNVRLVCGGRNSLKIIQNILKMICIFKSGSGGTRIITSSALVF